MCPSLFSFFTCLAFTMALKESAHYVGKQTSLKDQRASIAHQAKDATKDIRLTIQRVLEAHALMASKEQVAQDESSPTLTIVNVQKDRTKKSSMIPARGVLGGYKKVKTGKGWLFEDRNATEEDAVHDWGASLARRGPSKPLTNKGSVWRRDLGTLNGQQDLRKQSEIVQQVISPDMVLLLVFSLCPGCGSGHTQLIF